MHEPVPVDVATEIRELSSEGLGNNQISAFTGVYSSTVRQVISGKHKSYSDKLSARQVQAFINIGFGSSY